MSHTTPHPEPQAPAWSRDDLADDPHANADKAGKVRRMFAAIAPSYDLNNRLHSFGRDQAWRRAAVRMAGVGAGDHVLDMACGTGDLTRLFAEAGAARVVGADFTQEMLDVAVGKGGSWVGEDGDAERSRPGPAYLRADAMELPFEDGSFDIVSIAFGLRNIADPARALGEFRRVLGPGGRLVVLEFDRPRFAPVRWGNDFYCRRVMPITATLISRDRSGAYRYLPKSISTFLTRDGVAQAMREAGFEGIEQRPLTFGVCCCSRGVVPPAQERLG